MIRKTPFLALFLFASCVLPRVSFANTVTLTLESANGSPYAFSIDGSPNLVELSCLNDQRSVHTGESWTADVINLGAFASNSANTSSTVVGGTSGVTLGQLEVDAFLETDYTSKTTSTTNTEVQDAIWSVLDGKYVYTGLSGSSEDNAVQGYINAAIAAVGATKNTSSFYNEFTFYYPQTWGAKDSIPQQFLGYSAPVTPEPSSLMLLGTGIVGLAGAMRRRIMKSIQG